MRVGFSRVILLQAAFIGIFALILAAPHAVSAQSADTEQQQFADAWMAEVGRGKGEGAVSSRHACLHQ